jgi:hypothetical protein
VAWLVGYRAWLSETARVERWIGSANQGLSEYQCRKSHNADIEDVMVYSLHINAFKSAQ